jgi:hypothetical protein
MEMSIKDTTKLITPISPSKPSKDKTSKVTTSTYR